MKNSNIFLRSVTFITGLFIMALGVTLSVKANLGVSPISCVPYVFSMQFPLTLGQTTIIMNVVLILLQIALLRKNYQLFQLIQFPVVLLFGFFIDFTMHMFLWLEPIHYFGQALLCLLSCIVLALGVFFEVKAKLTYLPGEGLAMAITKTFNVEFGKSKIGTDSSMVLIGIISSYAFLSGIEGIREGTVVAAVLVGYIVRFYNRRIRFFDKWIIAGSVDAKAEIQKNKLAEGSRLVITISREYGSGGHEIGKAVAQKLRLQFYDKELIQLTSEQSGFTKEYIHQHEQKLAHSLLYQLYEQNYAYINERKPPLDALFLVQSKVIHDVSQKESCVIVGRCANFILKDQPGCFHVFIHADKNYRAQRIAQKFGVTSDTASREMEKMDRERANYCRHYTGRNWKDAANYDLTINSSSLGIEESANLIISTVLQLNNRQNENKKVTQPKLSPDYSR